MWELAIKNADHWRTDAFKLWCWRRLLRVPWTARRSNQYILKEINPEYSLEGLMLKLKLHYFGHLMWRANLLEKTLMLGKIESKRRRGGKGEMVRQHHWLKRHESEQTPEDSGGQRSLVCCSQLYIARIINAEKALAPHSSTLAWKIPWTEEPGRL